MIRILHIDDDVRDYELTSINLKGISEDIALEWVESAREALDLIKEKSYDCILCDFQMPRMSGLELLGTLREQNIDTPFIFLTGQGNEKIAAEAFHAGADDYFSKDPSFAHYDRIVNSIKRIVKACADRKERFEALEALRESEEKFSKTFNTSPDSIVITNLEDGRIIDLNHGFETMSGYSREEALGKTAFQLNLWNSAEQREQLVGAMKKDGFVRNMEVQSIKKNGDVITVLVSSDYIEFEGEKHLLTSSRDISDRKKAAEAIVEKEKFLRNVIDNSPQIIFCKTLDGKYILANRQYERSINIPEQDMLGKTDRDWFQKEDADRFVANDKKVATTKRPEVFEEIITKPDGNLVFSTTKVPVFDSEGNVNGVLGIATDITEQKAAVEALKKEKNFSDRLLEEQRDTVFLFDPASGTPLRWNSKLNEITGYSDEEIASMKVPDDFYCPEDLERAAKAVKETQTEGGTLVELPLKTKTGKSVPFEYSTSTIEDANGKPLVISVGRNVSARKRSEDALKASEAQLQALFNNAAIGIGLADTKGKYIKVNDHFLKMFNYNSEEELFEKTVLDITHPDDREETRALQKSLTLGDTDRMVVEKRYLQKDGKHIWGETSVTPVQEPDGSIKAFVAVVKDTTERKLAEKALRESEEKFATAFHASPQLMAITRLSDDCLIDVNHSFASHTGFSREELIGNSSTNLGLWVDPEVRSEAKKNLLENGFIQNVEIQMKKKSGEHFYLRVSGKIVHLSDESHLITVANDVTEHRRAEQALRESEEKFAKAFHASPQQIAISKLSDKTIVDVNDSVCKTTGYSREEIIGKTSLELGLWDNLESRNKTVEYLRSEGGVKSIEIELINKKGQKITSMISGEVIQLNNEPHLITVANDITERKVYEEELHQSRNQLKQRTDELEALNKELESFSYSVSHDLKAPLRQIEGFGNLLKDRYSDRLDNTGKEFLNNVLTAGKNMNVLIVALLELSRVKRNELERTEINLSAVALRIIDGLQAEELERKIKVTIEDDLVILADRGLFEIVLNNLLSNAFKFTRKEQITRIKVGSKKITGKTAYFVRDNGVGFEQKYADKLFRPFQRLHDEKEFEGTGIGLATVQRIIHRHGGKIWAEAEVGEGATFYFTFGN